MTSYDKAYKYCSCSGWVRVSTSTEVTRGTSDFLGKKKSHNFKYLYSHVVGDHIQCLFLRAEKIGKSYWNMNAGQVCGKTFPIVDRARQSSVAGNVNEEVNDRHATGLLAWGIKAEWGDILNLVLWFCTWMAFDAFTKCFLETIILGTHEAMTWLVKECLRSFLWR